MTDMKCAMKAGEKSKLGALRNLIGKIKAKQIIFANRLGYSFNCYYSLFVACIEKFYRHYYVLIDLFMKY